MTENEIRVIEKRLDALQLELERELGTRDNPGTIPRLLLRLRDDIGDLATVLRGLPSEPGGLVLRVDRLEVDAARRKRFEWLTITALITGAVSLAGVVAGKILDIMRAN